MQPALLSRQPLAQAADLTQHTLLHADTRPTAWPRWLTLAGAPELKPACSLHFDKFSLALQAAVDGLGVVLGPLPMAHELIAAGKLVSLCRPGGDRAGLLLGGAAHVGRRRGSGDFLPLAGGEAEKAACQALRVADKIQFDG
ncbi:DNA-binding transcriptional activator GcvA [Chromobacterium violaceum]|uniref:DNA-binding transcriptional activator GcvA n=1 Tax=Chromobacterium violaceum TaxID=536 RepID=A0A447TE87_CHRVL|nr:DNA-binding transcriptional activator GcvA [Chromobacterium violaceum]